MKTFFSSHAFKNAGGLRLVLIFSLLLAWGAGCSDNKGVAEQSDLEKARVAMAHHDVGDAEMYLERYLRKNPRGEERWRVWQELVSIALDIRNDNMTARVYLELMLMEFAGDHEKRLGIQMRLAELCDEMRKYDRSFVLWKELAEDSGLADQAKAGVYRELAHAYLRRLEFTPATDTLSLCLALNVSGATKAECLYSLAEAQLFTEDLQAAEGSLRQALNIEGITDDRRVLTTFMLGDVLEQRNKLAEALSCFEEIRSTYPNEKVIGMRITHLRKVMK